MNNIKFEHHEHIEDVYPMIVKMVMEHILKEKQQCQSSGLIELVSDFCFKTQLPVELVGDAIASDVYFKSFLEKDYNYRSSKNNDW